MVASSDFAAIPFSFLPPFFSSSQADQIHNYAFSFRMHISPSPLLTHFQKKEKFVNFIKILINLKWTRKFVS